MKEPLVPGSAEEQQAGATTAGRARPPLAKTIGARETKTDEAPSEATRGRVLGTFRNTYYDFPRESDHRGEAVALKSASCETIANVPRGFHDAVCVQGSGSLARGGTVSFAKRDCPCAEVCPRTGQRICFEALDPERFPWGRGAAGRPIVPLRSVAADTNVLPMGTVLYIPELDGVSGGGGAPIDGCFVVEDRGLRVQGEHVDIFTGDPRETASLNAQVPSNRGVTVIVDTPKCGLEIRRAP
jgi:3D (Asp-Asp-Asp) domain-containing protein